MSETSVGPTRRPHWATRIAAGVVVVLAMLVPVAALVFLILHLFHALSFSQLA
jgi:hypothetical protein